jgi:hypothetical protein
MSRTYLTALAITALAVTGCGASTKSSGTSGSITSSEAAEQTLTRPNLIAKADAVCHRVNMKRTSNKIGSQQEIAHSATELASYERHALTELNKLVPPAFLANDWRQILANRQTIADDTLAVGRDVNSNNVTAAHTLLSEIEQVQRRMFAIARRDGFNDCAQTG